MKYTDQDLFNMISKSVYVVYREPSIFKINPGHCRVQGLAISELNEPELLLLPEGHEHPDYYPVNEIILTCAPHENALAS